MVLLLNQDCSIIKKVSAQKALTLYLSGKVCIIEYGDRYIRTMNNSYRLPKTVILSKYANIPSTPVRLSKKAIHERDCGICQYCGCRPNEITIDHVVSRSRGGRHTWENMVSCCHDCNIKKGASLPSECGMELLNPPTKPKKVFKVNKYFNGKKNNE